MCHNDAKITLTLINTPNYILNKFEAHGNYNESVITL